MRILYRHEYTQNCAEHARFTAILNRQCAPGHAESACVVVDIERYQQMNYEHSVYVNLPPIPPFDSQVPTAAGYGEPTRVPSLPSPTGDKHSPARPPR